MHRLKLVGSITLGFVIGGVFLNSGAAYADLPTIDIAAAKILTTISDVMSTVNTGIQDVKTALGLTGPIGSLLGTGKFGTVQDLLQQGFTQESNYAKASVGAQQQIADASNTANARFQRDMRNAEIRDEQTPSPTACAAIDGGVSTQSASVQAFGVGAVVARIHDQRGEAAAGMPSYFGQAQGIASMAQEHANLYCNSEDVKVLGCGLSEHPDADQQMMSLFGSGTYVDQNAVNTAKDYAVTLIQPVAPAAIRGDQLGSTAGQDAAVRRRSYNARMSLAQSFVDNAIGMQTPSVPLTPLQSQYIQNLGLPAQTHGSWMQVMQIESERRVGDLTWNAEIQSMPPASVVREIASELALNNYLMFQIFKLNLMHTTVSATQLAEDTDRNFMPAVRMPTPSMAAN